MEEKIEKIEKENVSSLKFPNNDVLDVEDEIVIKERIADLKRALSLGNLEHSKMKIYFEDDESKKMVETTIWALTDKSVLLKQGVKIPINRILKIV